MALYYAWHHGYSAFQDAKTDTLILVSPGDRVMLTCDPIAANSIFRDSSFGKPKDLISLLNIFGPTITGSDGSEARLYRRITAPFFGQATMKEVWTESVISASILMQVVNENTEELRPILARLTLYLLNVLCFEAPQNCLRTLRNQERSADGQTLGYSQAMATFLENFPIVSYTPSLLLGI